MKTIVVETGSRCPLANSASTAAAGAGSGLARTMRLGQRAAQRAAALHQVLDLLGLGSGVVVRRVLELVVRDRQLDPVAEDAELLLGELLGLVGHVPGLDPGPQRPALDGLGQDDRGRTLVFGRSLVGGVHLAVVVSAPAKFREVVVGQVLHELLEAWVRAEEMVPDVGAAGHRELLELAVERLVHLLDQEAVHVASQELVPLARPDDLDDVPARPAEGRLQLLDDLAVAPDRSVEALQVAVHDERQVVQALASRDVERAQRFGLVGLAVAEERPDPGPGCVEQAAVEEIPVEASLVDGADRPEAHRDRRVLPELRHEARVRVRRQAFDLPGLAPEMVELVLSQATLEERPRVDPRGGMALVEDLVAGTVGVAAEEVIEADLVQARRRCVGRQVPADAREARVRPQHHRHRIPADDPPDAQLHRLVAREIGLLLRADGVDVPGLSQGRQTDVKLASPLEELVDEEPRAGLALLLDHLVERLQPLIGLVGVDIGQLMLELVEVHDDRSVAHLDIG